jgi:hypothetical protein
MTNQMHQGAQRLLLVMSIGGFIAAGILLVSCTLMNPRVEDDHVTSTLSPSQPTVQSTPAPVSTQLVAPPKDIILTQGFTATPLSGHVEPPSDTPGPTLKIYLAKREFQLGEPISVTLVVRNNITLPLTITRDLSLGSQHWPHY